MAAEDSSPPQSCLYINMQTFNSNGLPVGCAILKMTATDSK